MYGMPLTPADQGCKLLMSTVHLHPFAIAGSDVAHNTSDFFREIILQTRCPDRECNSVACHSLRADQSDISILLQNVQSSSCKSSRSVYSVKLASNCASLSSPKRDQGLVSIRVAGMQGKLVFLAAGNAPLAPSINCINSWYMSSIHYLRDDGCSD